MKKQLIMTAVALAMGAGIFASGASAAPVVAGIGASNASTSLAEKVHYRQHHRHYGHRHWRPHLFGYLKKRHHHHHHHHHHNRRHHY